MCYLNSNIVQTFKEICHLFCWFKSVISY